ncbi:LPS export ABC transporter periplasmic protein LptC [Dyella sp.]|jgi:lipopolysaccharide export system protein LptC|uniref:LPS export ABC transporter periplasmic protein LptC n=1 Tax=Dyella sp. TaxID=1869338 RepID=UPI002D79E706|nr:LPS export ABC transporter periplasmic protein LptC [Dyella sp.]HET6430702.1 LPS export ABC transporter periplasmic protein LptC [Dyella sp.]
MNVLAWLRERRLPAAIVVIGLLAGVTQLVRWWTAPEPGGNDFVGPPRSGYTLTEFALSSYDQNGLPAFNVKAPHLERRDGDESLYINSPVFDLPSNQPGVPDWRGESLYGWVSKDGALLKLLGPVSMHRAAFADSAAARLTTADASIWPRENRMETAAAARMVQGAFTMSGVGMRANLADKHLELLDDVHATFPPRKH